SLPIVPLSWVAVAGLSLYILLLDDSASSARRSGAIILLALTVPMLWSRLLFQFFANIILSLDAAMVALVLGTERAGNTVGFADGSGYMVIAPTCTSFTNLSFVFLCWVSITQWAKHPWSAKDLLLLFVACVSVVIVNVVRIVVTGTSHRAFELIHGKAGDQ